LFLWREFHISKGGAKSACAIDEAEERAERYQIVEQD
jgi:hypothetical protein